MSSMYRVMEDGTRIPTNITRVKKGWIVLLIRDHDGAHICRAAGDAENEEIKERERERESWGSPSIKEEEYARDGCCCHGRSPSNYLSFGDWTLPIQWDESLIRYLTKEEIEDDRYPPKVGR